MMSEIYCAGIQFMSWTIILALGSGSLKSGFPHVTAELKETGKTFAKFPASLPPAPEVEELHRRWKVLCNALKPGSAASRIKLKSPGVTTNFSEDTPEEIYPNLYKHMREWLASDEFCKKIELNLRTYIGNISESFKIFLENDNSQLWELPWDAWALREVYANCEIILTSCEYGTITRARNAVPVVRFSEGRILCVFGNSQGIDIKKDRRTIEKLLGDRCELNFLKEPTAEKLYEELFDEKGWQVLFFAGHSNSDWNAANGLLYINQNPDNNTITVEELKSGLKQAISNGLQLLIFNSCSSLGIATDIVAEGLHLPSIIVMRAPLPDPIAHDFVKSLFEYLALGDPLFLAVRKAKNDLLSWEPRFPGASGIPMLCQHPTFDEFILPRWKAENPVNPPFSEAQAGDRPNHGNFMIPTQLMQRASISLAVVAIGYPLIGPHLGAVINTFGMEKHRNNQFLIAKVSYNLAASLDPTNGYYFYNLSLLCDQINEDECAEQAMKQAVWRGLPEAYAQLAKSLIVKNKPQAALKVIGLCLEQTEFDGVKSACLKNRGWLRFNDNQYDSAEADLRTAISLNTKTPEAQCLLAKVLEAKGKPQESLKHWAETIKSGEARIPEQDECIQIAKQRLQKIGNSP
ncbi:CHAT domain-containing protein [Microcoleus sp. bin38.metabat.b11b12b14.051]|uniref:CHAT domain-containing tetratricopeptide repeat protein n=1 Tax=Microcoleus sp. bin38.metabat.b11b12b14.051 TaxID=2742709 RepID=UPI0025CD7E61|nr:CHAT domain-containing protein [Microcoleus sp. bin38.metabat.b11b12b14.051]